MSIEDSFETMEDYELGVKMLKLPYQEGVSMLILLPNKGKDYTVIDEEINAATLLRWIKSLHKTYDFIYPLLSYVKSVGCVAVVLFVTFASEGWKQCKYKIHFCGHFFLCPPPLTWKRVFSSQQKKSKFSYRTDKTSQSMLLFFKANWRSTCPNSRWSSRIPCTIFFQIWVFPASSAVQLIWQSWVRKSPSNCQRWVFNIAVPISPLYITDCRWWLSFLPDNDRCCTRPLLRWMRRGPLQQLPQFLALFLIPYPGPSL